MLKNMFDEYRFFPQFPEKELQITGQLFGGIIDQGLVALVMGFCVEGCHFQLVSALLVGL